MAACHLQERPAAVFEDLFESNDGAKGPLMRTWRKPIQRQTGKKRRAPFARARIDPK
jgi:hypothetical protein